MRLLPLVLGCLLALTLFLVEADWASAQSWQGQARGGTTMTQSGRGAAQYRGGTATGTRGTATGARRGGATAQRGGGARPARAGELDPMLAAGALGGLGMLAFVGGRGVRRRFT